jgi:hypothetical protein
MALVHIRALKTKQAIWPALLIVLSQLKNISDVISHWQNIQWIWMHAKTISMKEHVQLAMLAIGLIWLAVIALWPGRKGQEPALIGASNISNDRPLVHRMLALADELKAFLKNLGPEPEVIWRVGMSPSEFNEANKDATIRSQKMEAMFYRRFHPRVTDIYNEACEMGTIHDSELEKLLKTRADNDSVISGVINRLAAVAAEVSVKQ